MKKRIIIILVMLGVVGVAALQNQYQLAIALVVAGVIFLTLAGNRLDSLFSSIASTGDTQLTPNYLIGIFLTGVIAVQATIAQSQSVFIQAGSFIAFNWLLNYVVIIIIAPRVLKTFDIQNFGDEAVQNLFKIFKIPHKNFYKTEHSALIADKMAIDMRKYGKKSNFFAMFMFFGGMVLMLILCVRELLNGFGIGLFAVNAQFTALESLVNPASLISHHWEKEIMVSLFVCIAFLTGGGGNKKFAFILSITGVSYYLLQTTIGLLGISANYTMFLQMLNPLRAIEWATLNPETTAIAMGATGFAFIPALQATLGLATSGIEGQVENTRSNGGVKNTQHLALVNMVLSVIANLGILIFASQITDHTEIKQADYFYLSIKSFGWFASIALGLSIAMGINASSTLVVSIQSFYCHTIGTFLAIMTKKTSFYPIFKIRGEKGKENALIAPIFLAIMFIFLAYTMSHDAININYGVVIFITLGIIGSFVLITLVLKVIATKRASFEDITFILLSIFFVLLQAKMFPTEKALNAYVLWGLILGIGGLAWAMKRWKHHTEKNDELDETH